MRTPPQETGIVTAVNNGTQALRGYHETPDTDGDGRSDWQEELEGTDPYTADSASTTGRRTYESIEEIFAATPGVTPSQSNTFTDRFARAYAEELVRSKNNTNGLSNEEITAEALAAIENATTYKEYGPQDLLLIQDATREDVRAYGNELGAVLSEEFLPANMNPFAVIMKALQDNDPEMAKRLLVFAKAYEYVSYQVVSLPVPDALVPQHLALLNTFSKIQAAYAFLDTQLFDDPVLALGYYTELIAAYEEVHAAVAALESALSERNIYYSSDEPGSRIFMLKK